MTTGATRFVDLTAAELVEHAIRRGEGTLAANGAFVAITGKRTGRSPKDRFIVQKSICVVLLLFALQFSRCDLLFVFLPALFFLVLFNCCF